MKTLVKPILLLILFIQISLNINAQARISPNLFEVLQTKEDTGFIPVIITLKSQYNDESLLQKADKATSPQKRRELVVNELKAFSQKTQSELLNYLQKKEQEGHAEGIRSFWIGNFVHVFVSREVIEELTARKDISLLDFNKEFHLLDLDNLSPGKEFIVHEKDRIQEKSTTWNINHLLAEEVWQMGYTGQNIVVAVLDTGVNYEHSDLQGNMWEHPDFPMHGFNFADNNLDPMDYNGHGTHCAGTVAGNGASGTQTGIAPNARIMALKVLTDQGSGTQVAVWEAVQFAVENGAHVLSLSLGFRVSGNPNRAMMRTVMNNLRSAGLVAFVAAGNEGTTGQIPFQVRTPGDVPPPWLHPDQPLIGGTSGVISIGSFDENGFVAGTSSRGPVEWNTVNPFNDYPFNPGMGLIRPDVVAPGVNIISLDFSDVNGYANMSGTSMATPAAAGVAALMLSRNPFLLPEDISQILEETASPLSFIKSNTSGSGVINALAAIEQTPFGLRYAAHSINDEQGNDNGMINPSEFIHLNVSIENPAEISFNNVEVLLRTQSPYISLNDSVFHFEQFLPGEILSREDAFSFQVADNIPGDHTIKFTLLISQQEDPKLMISRFSEIAYAPALSAGNLIIDDSEQGNNNGILEAGESALLRFEISNTGMMDSDSISLSLTSLTPYVQTANNSVLIPSIKSNESVTVDFMAEAHPEVPLSSPAKYILLAESGAYTIEREYVSRMGLTTETWESGNFEQFDWEFNAQEEPWKITSDETFGGDFAVRSGEIFAGQNSTFKITFDVQSPDSISFWLKTSSSSIDQLRFFIDGTMLGQWSGNQDWLNVSFPVEPGTRTFSWSYQRGILPAQNDDCAWVDNIVLPITPSQIVFAGFDNQVCGDNGFEMQGYADGYETLQWSTSGDGHFDHPDSLQAIYFPGDADMSGDFVDLSLAIFDADGAMLSIHSMGLIVFPGSEEITLGEDMALCVGKSLLLDAGEGFESYLWSDGSQRQTLLVNANEPDIENPYWVTATDENGCESFGSINISFEDCVDTSFPQEQNPRINLYPNPASSFLKVEAETQIQKVVISDMTGRILKVVDDYAEKLMIRTSELTPGIYLIFVYTTKGLKTEKVIIQNMR